MVEHEGTTPVGNMLGLLLRMKARATWNRVRQAVDQGPVRLAATLLLISLVWFGLYALFWLVFDQFRRTPLEATVALPLIFNFFFVALLLMLTFSNAIIAYGTLFGRRESVFLLTAPVRPRDVVSLKYLESLALSSWSLVLLGIPLMMAIADQAEEPLFYLLFTAFFLAFIPIPGGFGLLFAWVAARFFPRRAIRLVTLLLGSSLGGFLVWGLYSLQLGESPTESWLRDFLSRMSFVESAILPNYWIASGIDRAVHGQFADAALYLGVTAANALFVSWLAVTMVSCRFDAAFDRASAAGPRLGRSASQASGGIAGNLFAYLPVALRLIAAKDLRGFLRDPLQWSQLVILFGLLALYLTNMPTLRLQFSGTGWFLVIPFLNLCALSLILATFTCRFVFPLPSLEGQKLWLIGLLPLPLGDVLLAKFAFAMTVTTGVAVAAMALATVTLGIEPIWAVIHFLVTVAICFGLCGFAIGLGARFPVFREPNAARIANGFGGTANLLASVALVATVLAGVGVATWRCRSLPTGAWPDLISMALCFGAFLVSLFAGSLSLHVGIRHFNRVEA